MLGRLLAIMIKEFLEISRDKAARFILVVPPILQMPIFGYAASFEVYHVSTAVLDLDHSQESRDLIARFTASNRFDIVKVATSPHEINKTIDASAAAVALVIDAGFAELLRKGQAAPLQVIVDGSNSNTALIALGYINTIATGFAQDYATDLAERVQGVSGARQVQVTLEQRPWYNPDLNGRWFFVPGVIGTLTLILIVNLTAFAIVREREVGTLEQIMVSPIRPAEFILGKTVPFFLIGLGEVALVVSVGLVWFRIPFVGSPFVVARHHGVSALHADDGSSDFNDVLHPAASILQQFLHPQSGFHLVRLRLSDLEHAARLAVVHLRQSAALLPDRHSRRLTQGRRLERALAGICRYDHSRDRPAYAKHPALPQDAGIAIGRRCQTPAAPQRRTLSLSRGYCDVRRRRAPSLTWAITVWATSWLLSAAAS
jgi:ABC-2 type transport system permease protein